MSVRYLFTVSLGLALAAPGAMSLATDIAPASSVLISEIGYHPPSALGADALLEFVELHNRSAERVEISGWRLHARGSNDAFILPPATVLEPDAYLALARESDALKALSGGIDVIGGLPFSLGNGGDVLRLHDPSGRLIDRVRYDDAFPWPHEADGEGATLERIDVADDRTGFINFAPSPVRDAFGTPGAPNASMGSIAARHDVVINEILYNPVREPSVDPLRHCAEEEFLELFHRGDEAIDLSGWQLAGGVRFQFPPQTILSPGGFLVVVPDLAAFTAKYGNEVRPLGPYDGQLADGGEDVALLDTRGQTADFVNYADDTPWPIRPDGIAGSLELADPWSDNSRGRAWRQSDDFRGTPGRRNSATTRLDGQGGSAGAQITDLAHFPQADPDRGEIFSTDRVVVQARVAGRAGVKSVLLEQQVVPAGAYIARSDPEFETTWSATPMELHADSGLYTATLPPANHRTLVRYRVVATDGSEATTYAPWQDDPEPNRGYFVYDGVPDYVANRRSAFGPPGFVHTNLTKIPVCHVIGREGDIHDAQYGGFLDNEYRWQVSVVHDNRVYDHCGIRLRGTAGTRFGTPKRSWKVRFNKGNRFRGHFSDGTPYPRPRSKLNLMRGAFGRGGGAGAYETLGWRFYREADVVAAATSFVHLRMVRSVEEHDQFDGDFFGIFLDVQAIDNIALRDNNRPVDDEARLYKFDRVPDKKHPDCDDSRTKLDAFQSGVRDQATREWLDAHLDVDRYLSFTVIKDLIDDDKDNGFNYFYYFNSEASRWEVVPWDLDRSFGINPSGEEPLRSFVLNRFPIEFRNRFRFLWQTLYAPDRIRRLIDEMRVLVEEIAAADIDRWDTEPNQACPTCDESPPTGMLTHKTYERRMRDLEVWTTQQRQVMIGRFLDDAIPWTPKNTFPPDEGTAATPVLLRAGTFGSSSPEAAHNATRWLLIAEGGDWTHPAWHLETDQDLAAVEVPPDITEIGARYQFRVAHRDTSGRWSLLSAPTTFEVHPEDATRPSPPGELVLDALEPHGAFLRWSAASDAESGIAGYVVERDGQPRGDQLVQGLRFGDTDVAPGETYEYRVTAVNAGGHESEPTTALTVSIPGAPDARNAARSGWRDPPGGFDYLYEAHPGEDLYLDPRIYKRGPLLDGTWLPSSISEWDGSAPGSSAGAPGGVAISTIESRGHRTNVLSLEDAGITSTSLTSPLQNRRLLFLRPIPASDLFTTGLTMTARFRVHPSPRDLPEPLGQDARSRGQIGLGHRVRPQAAHFQAWLHENQLFLTGADPIPVDEHEFQALWITLSPEDDGHRVRVYLQGSSEPVREFSRRLPASGIESSTNGTYLEMGLADRSAAGAIQIDYFGYKAGVHAPLAHGGAPFRRGDLNTDGLVDAADAVAALGFLFAGEVVACRSAADADASGRVNLLDAVTIIDYALRGGAALPPPFPGCGTAETGLDAVATSCGRACP